MDLSWRDQLTKVRTVVIEQEKRREVEKKLERERNEEALTARLKKDTPEALSHKLTELKQRLDTAARKLYPPPHLEKMSEELNDQRDILAFYIDCMKSFPKVFNQSHKSSFPGLLADVEGALKGFERQMKQWGEIKQLLDGVVFRARRPEDDSALVAITKEFSERAHDVPLSIPGDYYSREKDNFWAVESAGKPIGYIKFWPSESVVTFALTATPEINFNKLVRGILYRFATQGPMPAPLAAIRVKITFPREAKFFSDLGFMRTETKGPSEWIYSREV